MNDRPHQSANVILLIIVFTNAFLLGHVTHTLVQRQEPVPE